MDEKEMRRLFGCGEAGSQVPQADPLDIKAAWDLGQSVKKDHPEGGVGIGVEVFKAHCKPGATIAAVTFRGGQLWILGQVAPDLLAPWTKDGQFDDVIFRAIAQVPMEWIGVGITHEGLPFDVEDFMRRVREAT